MFTTLIEPAELHVHAADADWAVIDCRFDLARPAWGEESWAAGHIPGALYAHLDRDLSGAHTPDTGRHPLPAVSTLASLFSGWGIDAAVQVVAYDQGPGAYAARLWWLLRWLGHRRTVPAMDQGRAIEHVSAAAIRHGPPRVWRRAG